MSNLGAPVLDIALQLRGRNAAMLLAEARKRRREPAELLADLIEAVLTDNLVDAVLDDASERKGRY